jgi:subtilase family serine protease
MHLRTLGLAALAVGFGLAATVAPAATNTPIQRSGNTFHMAVCGLYSLPGTARCHAHVVTDARGNILESPRNVAPHAGSGPSGYHPLDLQSAYNLSPPTGAPGSGPTIAIVDAYGYPSAESDLGVYRSQFGLGPCTTANGCFKKVDQNGGTNYPRTDTGWSQESALDLDMVSAMCPNCKIVLVEAASNSFANLGAAENYAASTTGAHAHAISNSYGGSDSSSSQSYESQWYNHSGVAITVSSGDSGYGVEFPASSQYVTAVGGTHLVRSTGGRGWTETAWSGAGSGCSKYVNKPSWQNDNLCTGRTVADVSAVADPNTGVSVYGPVNRRGSGWLVFGGTSVAAPLIAGIYGVNGGAVNYGSNPYASSATLFDITSGSNGSCGGSYFCTAGTGYDGPTGLGTPNGSSAF